MNNTEFPLYYNQKYGLIFYKTSNHKLTSDYFSSDPTKFNGFDTEGYYQLQTIFFSKDIREVEWNGLGRYNFNSFEVDSENPIFQQFDGILYTKKGYDRHGNINRKRMIELVACPTNIISHNVILGTIRIANCAFKGTHISKLTFPNTLEEIGVNAFYFTDRLKSIAIPDSIRKIEQQKESSIDTIIYDYHIFHNWNDLFDYMIGHGFKKENGNIVRQQVRKL